MQPSRSQNGADQNEGKRNVRQLSHCGLVLLRAFKSQKNKKSTWKEKSCTAQSCTAVVWVSSEMMQGDRTTGKEKVAESAKHKETKPSASGKALFDWQRINRETEAFTESKVSQITNNRRHISTDRHCQQRAPAPESSLGLFVYVYVQTNEGAQQKCAPKLGTTTTTRIHKHTLSAAAPSINRQCNKAETGNAIEKCRETGRTKSQETQKKKERKEHSPW